MWVYRVEKPHRNPKHQRQPRVVDIEYSPQYALRGTHLQRLATVHRVPLFEGYTMPSVDSDSDTSAMFKQVILRPLSVPINDDPADIQLVEAFSPLCAEGDGATAYTRAWAEFSERQQALASKAQELAVDRLEWPSIWETAEVVEELHDMYLEKARVDAADAADGDASEMPSCELDPEWCHDRDKPRVSVEQYTAFIGAKVAVNLEGIGKVCGHVILR